jgi:CHAT domain-containing protein
VLATDRSLVIVPTGRLHGLAWRALPSLAARPTVVAPSLMACAVATRAGAIRRASRTLLIGGPALTAASAELAALARIHRNAVVLDVDDSTAERCIARLGEATLAHLACHGSFRSDNPLFSTLRVADGDITVYDLEQCRRLPRTMVLSACNAAASAVLRGGALLGMSSALIQLGVSSVIAPLTPVSDDRSVALMIRLHQGLRAGESPAEALARAALVDGELDATAAAFVALGA